MRNVYTSLIRGEVLGNASADFNHGGIVVILGARGSDKTTLPEALVRLVEPL